MKEYGMLFDAESMRANLDRRKTQDRRVINPQPPETVCTGARMVSAEPPGTRWALKGYEDRWGFRGADGIASSVTIRCPYGQPGDRIWAKETYALNIPGCPYGLTCRADHIDPLGDGPANPIKWRSPLFMPRWASRFVAEIISVRVERVQDISEADALAEGIDLDDGECKCGEPMRGHRYDGHYHTPVPMFSAREVYRDRWDAINAKRGYGWNVNPWVWVVEYRAVQP